MLFHIAVVHSFLLQCGILDIPHNLSIFLLINIGLFEVLSMNILVHASWACECKDSNRIVGS